MNIKEFEELLKNHDWTYMFSDDQRYWRAGNESMKKIRAALLENSGFQDLYDEYRAKYFGDWEPE